MGSYRSRELGFSPSSIIGGGKVEEGRSWVRSGPRTVECTVCILGSNIGPAMSFSPHLPLSLSLFFHLRLLLYLQLATRVSRPLSLSLSLFLLFR